MWLHRYAVFVTACTFLALVAGAWYTRLREAPETSNPITAAVHLAAGVVIIALTLALSPWLMKAGLGELAWLALALVVLDGVLGGILSGRPAPASHATVSHVLFALAAASAVCTSSAWRRGPETVFDQGWPSLRSWAVVTPTFVLAQVALGAAFRHRVTGLTWHIGSDAGFHLDPPSGNVRNTAVSQASRSAARRNRTSHHRRGSDAFGSRGDYRGDVGAC